MHGNFQPEWFYSLKRNSDSTNAPSKDPSMRWQLARQKKTHLVLFNLDFCLPKDLWLVATVELRSDLGPWLHYSCFQWQVQTSLSMTPCGSSRYAWPLFFHPDKFKVSQETCTHTYSLDMFMSTGVNCKA